MTFSITDDGLLLEEVLDLSRPPPRQRAHAIAALRQSTPLFDYLSLAQNGVAHLLNQTIEDTSEGLAAQEAFAILARGHALDMYADAGLQAQAWPHAVAEAIHTLRTLLEETGHLPRTWAIQSQRFALVLSHDAPSAPRSKTTALRLVDAPVGVHFCALTMTEVEAEIAARPARHIWRAAKRLCALAPALDLPMLAIATGALQALTVVSALTGYPQLSLGGGLQDWHAQLSSGG